MTKEELIEKIIDDMWERPFARTWEWEAKNMRKILKKHIQQPTQDKKLGKDIIQIAKTIDNMRKWDKIQFAKLDWIIYFEYRNYPKWMNVHKNILYITACPND